MNYWLLQANPDQFDVTTYVEQFENIYWSLKKEAWQRKAAVGDEVFIWRAQGSSKAPSGVVAHGYVTEPATEKGKVRHAGELAENLWQAGYSELSTVKLGIRLTSRRTTPEAGMLLKKHFLSDPVLSRAQIITVRSGAVFLLPQPQAQRIRDLWFGDGATEEFESTSGLEGAVTERIHRIRERDRSLVSTAKRLFLEKHGSLFCSVCGFSFSKVYGALGQDFIEAHHTKPVGERDGASETRVEDLVMVCSNCHRMIHRDGKYEENYKRLVAMFDSTASSLTASR